MAWSAGPCSTTWVRRGYLVFTLVWIGWYAQAQLSVVNVLAFPNALRTDFRWDYFLMAPLIFILWFATAAPAAVLESRAVLRLAVPVRRVAGTDQPHRPAAEDPAIQVAVRDCTSG